MLGLEGNYMDILIEKYDWKFYFDKNRTLDYYENYSDLCQCESCRNFYENVNFIPNEIKNFLKQFGIDIAKPIEQVSIIADKSKKMVENTVYYAVNGNASSLNNSEITLGQSVIEVVPKEKSPNTNIAQPYFVFAVHDIWLPWTVDYNIDDVYD